jgi:hypothetical protein
MECGAAGIEHETLRWSTGSVRSITRSPCAHACIAVAANRETLDVEPGEEGARRNYRHRRVGELKQVKVAGDRVSARLHGEGDEVVVIGIRQTAGCGVGASEMSVICDLRSATNRAASSSAR